MRASEGGSEITTNQLVAGVTLLGSDQNKIDTTSGVEIVIQKRANIEGDQASLAGSIIAQTMILIDDTGSNGVF